MEVLHDWICSSDIHDTQLFLHSVIMRYQDDLVHINNLSSDYDYVVLLKISQNIFNLLMLLVPITLRLYKIDGSYYVINSDNIRYNEVTFILFYILSGQNRC